MNLQYVDHIEREIEKLKLKALNHAFTKYEELLRYCALPSTPQENRNYTIQMMHSLKGSIKSANDLPSKHIAKVKSKIQNYKTDEAFNGELDMTYQDAQAEYFQILADINSLKTK